MGKKYIKRLFTRVLLAIILFLVSSIYINYSDKNLLTYKKYFYNQTFNFVYINKFYDKYLGNLLPIKKEKVEVSVMNDELNIKNKNKYYDGVKLEVGENQTIKSKVSGIVVYLGEKENFGNTIIIQGSDGIDYWYGNLENISVKLYDYVEQDYILGNNLDNYFYMAFAKNGEYLNYEDFV